MDTWPCEAVSAPASPPAPGRGAVRASLLQNYVTPLRLVLSPVDMAAIFINLEVRVPPGSLCGGHRPNPLQCRTGSNLRGLGGLDPRGPRGPVRFS